MKSRLGDTTRSDEGGHLPRTLIVPFAALSAVAAIAIPLAVHEWHEEDVAPTSGHSPETTPRVDAPAATEELPATGLTDGGDAIRFGQFPLDQGWAEIYGNNVVNGPALGAGGISMPEGHCIEEVLFASGYEDKLSTYVTTDEGSRTREILGYADGGARSTFQSLRDAVASCAVFNDSYTDAVAYSAEVYRGSTRRTPRPGPRRSPSATPRTDLTRSACCTSSRSSTTSCTGATPTATGRRKRQARGPPPCTRRTLR